MKIRNTGIVQVGDWVQATQDVTEENFLGQPVWVHAQAGGIGHVMGVDGDWATITWERSGTTTDTHASEFKRLCDAGARVVVAT